jgi:flagellar biosynthetic protein FlhB
MSALYEESLFNLAALIDLQWFSEEDEGRTEEPTEEKLRRTREEEGRVAKSQELIGAVGLLFPALILLFTAPYMLRTCVEMVRFFLLRSTEVDPTKDAVLAGVFFSYFARLVWPMLTAAVIAGLFSNLVQVGFLFTTKPITPDFTRIIPRFGQYFRRTLFSMDGMFNFAKSIIKMAIIGSVAFFLIKGDIQKLVNLQKASLWFGVSTIASLASRMLIISALLLLILAVPDYMFQRWSYRKSLKMSRQEIKEERKMYEGDPFIKSHIRSRMRELLAKSMYTNVPKADVVVTNPTHFAVALEYNPENKYAPTVTAKGEDQVALYIKRVAGLWQVPIVENKPLARALYANVEIGQEVPVEYLVIVAKVYLKVMEINKLMGKENSIEKLREISAKRRPLQSQQTEDIGA